MVVTGWVVVLLHLPPPPSLPRPLLPPLPSSIPPSRPRRLPRRIPPSRRGGSGWEGGANQPANQPTNQPANPSVSAQKLHVIYDIPSVDVLAQAADTQFFTELRRELRRALPREQWLVLDQPVVQEASPRRENV